ncbi:MAG TPA: hypothetical protein VF789_31030 [Thermoanaerobaculia bacterium]
MAWGNKKSGGNGVAWLALLLAIAALLLAWSAYKRTGGELRDLWGDVRSEGRPVAEADWRADLAAARDRLLSHRPEVAGERNLQQVREDVAEIRADLERTYRNADAGVREQWRELDAELERLQGQLKDGSSKAVDTLDSLLAKLRVRPVEEEDGRR